MSVESSDAPAAVPTRARSPVRTLFVTHDGGLFGAQRMLLNLIKGVDPAFISPILAAVPNSPLASEACSAATVVDSGYLAHWVPTGFHLGKRGRILYAASVARRLPFLVARIRRLIRDHRVEVVYTNTVTIIEAALAARLERVPHIWHIHEPVSNNTELKPLLPARVYRAVVRKLSAKVIFPAASVAAEYGHWPALTQVVHNGIPIPAQPDRAAARPILGSRLHLPESAPRVGIIGTFNPRKDHETFLRMAALVSSQFPLAAFLICGSGSPERLELLHSMASKLGISESVKFIGPWPGEIIDFLAGIDVLVVSSEQESFGLTIVESMAAGTPVVATRCGGPEEIIDNGVTGMMAPRKDHVALAECVNQILGDAAGSAAMAARARRVVVDRFSIESYAHRIQETIAAVRSAHWPN